jgi:hypothetical protein
MFYEVTMNAEDFRRIALSFDGAEESSHMGAPDFRVGGPIFATLASQDDGFGNLKLTPELQQLLIAESPNVVLTARAAGELNGRCCVATGTLRTSSPKLRENPFARRLPVSVHGRARPSTRAQKERYSLQVRASCPFLPFLPQLLLIPNQKAAISCPLSIA